MQATASRVCAPPLNPKSAPLASFLIAQRAVLEANQVSQEDAKELRPLFDLQYSLARCHISGRRTVFRWGYLSALARS